MFAANSCGQLPTSNSPSFKLFRWCFTVLFSPSCQEETDAGVGDEAVDNGRDDQDEEVKSKTIPSSKLHPKLQVGNPYVESR